MTISFCVAPSAPSKDSLPVTEHQNKNTQAREELQQALPLVVSVETMEEGSLWVWALILMQMHNELAIKLCCYIKTP